MLHCKLVLVVYIDVFEEILPLIFFHFFMFMWLLKKCIPMCINSLPVEQPFSLGPLSEVAVVEYCYWIFVVLYSRLISLFLFIIINIEVGFLLLFSFFWTLFLCFYTSGHTYCFGREQNNGKNRKIGKMFFKFLSVFDF